MKRLLCMLLGHKFDPWGAAYYGDYHCERCGADAYQAAIGERIIYRLRLWTESKWVAWRRWWKCSDCGWYFGRHDPDQEDRHVPF